MVREGPANLVPADAAARRAAADRLVADFLERQRRGQPCSESEVLEAYPELHPELSEAVQRLRLIREALLDSREAGRVEVAAVPLSLDELEQPIEVPADGSSRASDADDASGEDFFPPEDAVDAIDPRLSIEGYELHEEVSDPKGTGQARVFRAVQRRTGRTVAVKVLHGGPYLGSKARKRYEREVKILGKLDHPNIVGVLDRARTADGSFFLVMDFVEGRQLDDFLDGHRATLNQRDVVALLRKVAAAVGEAHRNGVVHRDLKPSNVRVDVHGEPHVLDFGLARLLRDAPGQDASVTAGDHLVGTLLWASPEQVEGGGDRVREASDVYSLGLMMYRLLTGRFPYPVRVPPHEVVENIRTRLPEAPSSVPEASFGAVDARLEAILLKCLAKRPEHRYGEAGALAEDLRRYLADQPVQAPPRRTWRRWLRHPISLGVLAIGALGGGVAYLATRPPPPPIVIALRAETNRVGMVLIDVPSGYLVLGGSVPANRGTDGAARSIRMTHEFAISKTEVTRKQYAAVMGLPPPLADVEDLPVDQVSWDDAVAFCAALSAAGDGHYRLPTEAEWEYVCRAGRGTTYGGNDHVDTMGWHLGNSGRKLHPVARKYPNHWGVHDMHGNVDEWCLDAPRAVVGTADALEASAMNERMGRVRRGGSSFSPPSDCASARRNTAPRESRTFGQGFRVVRGELPPPPPTPNE